MKSEKTTSGAFNPEVIPTIACFNNATLALGVDFDSLIAAMQKYVDVHVAPVWGTPAKLIKARGFKRGAWAMVFLDNADQPGALAYHDLTPDGLPISKVFVKTTLDDKYLVSVSASHELVEMLVDPAVNMMTTGPDPKATYDYECADPVEEESFPVRNSDERFRLARLFRILPPAQVRAVRSQEARDQALSDSQRRLSGCDEGRKGH